MMSKTTFRELVLAMIICVVVVVVTAFNYRSSRYFEQAIIDGTQEHLLTIARIQAKGIEKEIENIQTKMQQADEPELQEKMFLDTVQALINRIIADQKDDTYVFDDKGTLIAGPNFKHVGKDLLTVNREIDPEYDDTKLKVITARMGRGEEGTGSYDSVQWSETKSRLERRLVAFSPVKVGSRLWAVAVSVGYYEISGPTRKHSQNLTLGGGCLIIIVLFAIWRLHRADRSKSELELKLEAAGKLEQINKELKGEIGKRAQTEEGNAKLLQAIESSQEAVSIVSPDGEVTYANNEMERLFGYEKGELIGRSASVLNARAAFSSAEETILEVVKDCGTWEGNVLGVRKDGTEFISYVTASVTLDVDGKLINVISTHRDITEQKRAEEKLNKTIEEVQRFNKLVVGRELRMAELKHEVNMLCHELEEEERYPGISELVPGCDMESRDVTERN